MKLLKAFKKPIIQLMQVVLLIINIVFSIITLGLTLIGQYLKKKSQENPNSKKWYIVFNVFTFGLPFINSLIGKASNWCQNQVSQVIEDIKVIKTKKGN